MTIKDKYINFANLQANLKILVAGTFYVPLFFNPFINAFENFETPKSYLIIFLSAVLLILSLKDWKDLLIVIKESLIIQIYLTFCFFVVVGGILGIDFNHSILGSYSRTDGLLFILATAVLLVVSTAIIKKSGKEFLLKSLVYSSVIVASLGIMQFVLYVTGLISADHVYDGRITSTFGQPNFMAGYLAACVPIIFVSQINHKKVILSIVLVAIILTFSKSAIFALLIALLVWYARNKWSSQKSKRVGVLILIVSALIFSGSLRKIYYLFERTPSLYQFQRVFFFLSPENLKYSLRGDLMKTAVESSTKNNFMGYGKGNIDYVYSTYGSEFFDDFDIVADSSHNLFTDILLESGIIALGLFVWFCYLIFKQAGSSFLAYSFGILLFRGFFEITPPSLWFLIVILVAVISTSQNMPKRDIIYT